jgi:hypothetical protein
MEGDNILLTADAVDDSGAVSFLLSLLGELIRQNPLGELPPPLEEILEAENMIREEPTMFGDLSNSVLIRIINILWDTFVSIDRNDKKSVKDLQVFYMIVSILGPEKLFPSDDLLRTLKNLLGVMSFMREISRDKCSSRSEMKTILSDLLEESEVDNATIFEKNHSFATFHNLKRNRLYEVVPYILRLIIFFIGDKEEEPCRLTIDPNILCMNMSLGDTVTCYSLGMTAVPKYVCSLKDALVGGGGGKSK